MTTNSNQLSPIAAHQVPEPVGNPQRNNQSFVGSTNSGNSASIEGINQGNSGNQGINRGFSQDNSQNGGNLLGTQRKNIGYQENYQSVTSGGSSGGNTTTLIGTNQGNSGNQGINAGLNQDNAGNSGNQVNNQGTVIGTQVNNQAGSVNNSGSLIEKQINNILLIPPLHLGLEGGLRPGLNVGLGR